MRGEKGEYTSGAVLEVHTGHIVPGLSGASVFNLTSKLHQLTLRTMLKVPTGENSGVGFFFSLSYQGLGGLSTERGRTSELKANCSYPLLSGQLKMLLNRCQGPGDPAGELDF